MGKIRSPKTFGKKIRDIENDIEKIHTNLVQKQTSLQEVTSIATGPSAETALRNFGNRNNDITELGEQFPGKTESDIKSHFDVLTDPASATATIVPPVNFYATVLSSSPHNTCVLSWVEPTGTGYQYEIKYSTSPARNSDGSPSSNPVTVSGTITGASKNVTGLSPNTTYYFWIRTKKGTDYSNWIGPQQTNTDPLVPSASSINFRKGTVTATTVQLLWNTPSGRTFTYNLYRINSDGTENRILTQSTNTSFTDSSLVAPNSTYNYRLQIYDETNSLFSSPKPTISVTTPNLSGPVFSATVQGQLIKGTITLPVDIGLCDFQVATNSGFTTNVVNQSFSRIGTSSAQSLTFTMSNTFNPSTAYFVRARLRFTSTQGPWSSGVSVTTTSVPQASRPSLTITSPSRGEFRIKVRFNDSVSYGDVMQISHRPGGSVGEYTHYLDFIRSSPPSDATVLIPNERWQLIRGGFTPGASYTFRAVVVRSNAQTSLADTDTETADN